MKFSRPLIEGVLIRRHSRFLADVNLSNGELITAHTSNTGSMAGCCDPGSRVWLSLSNNTKRKYAHTWEIVEVNGKTKVGINTLRANHLVREAICNGVVTELVGYEQIRAEVKYGVENSRVDFLLSNAESAHGNGMSKIAKYYVEVKNVTLVENGVAYFPDAVSSRGAKHLRELQEVAANGDRAVIFFCLQRSDAREVRPADRIDPHYGAALRTAVSAGVEALAYFARVSTHDITLIESVPVELEKC